MIRKRLFILTILFTLSCSFNVFAMRDLINGEYVPDNPGNETKYENRTLGSRWTWLSDEMCVQFGGGESIKHATIQKWADNGLIQRWAVSDGSGGRKLKTRDTYSGKWLQSAEGNWLFEFDDKTIPVGIAKIDDVLYAFNGFGELKEGYEYYDGLITAADGLVESDDPAFWDWLATQYLPECTSHD